MKLKILPLILIACLSACSSHSTKTSAPVQSKFVVESGDPLAQRLYAHYRSWHGVRHQDGGMDRSGIDCSGFVSLTYKELFNKRVPRTTELLVQRGQAVASELIETGDLVFFKTGIKRRHVGIYLGQNKFVHVSSKKGVMVSDLGNPYWNDAFWQVRRLL